MSVPWLDQERHLLAALDYLGVPTANDKGETWVLREANLLVEDDEDELVFKRLRSRRSPRGSRRSDNGRAMRILVPAPCRKRRCRSRLAELRACGRLHCIKCGADRGPLDRDAIAFIKTVENRFGPITDTVVLRDRRPT
jgi:hypothetical protein